MKRFISLSHYLAFLRRQPKHMQQVYAVLFSGVITIAVAAFILYSDYGFWRDTYNRNDIVEDKKTVKETAVDVQSPGDMMGDFLREANAKVKTINVSSSNILQGKDVYKKEKDTSSR